MPVRRITRRKVQKAPLAQRRFKRYRPVLVNEFGRVVAEGKSTQTIRQARLKANTLLYGTGFVRPSYGSPDGGLGGGDGGRTPLRHNAPIE